MKTLSALVLALSLVSIPAFATPTTTANDYDQTNLMDELDSFAPNIDEQLKQMDQQYEQETGKSPFLDDAINDVLDLFSNSCVREQCPIYLDISKSEQIADLYINGQLEGEYLVSTGRPGRETPDLDTHPDGRIYDAYTSTKFPGGDYNGMGNMPYAVFIKGGVAVHGTGQSNWKKLGHKASHGCIRMHPDNAFKFNRLVRENGVRNTWVRVR